MSLSNVLGGFFSTTPGHHMLLCGLNGAGKSTLLVWWQTMDGSVVSWNATNLNSATMSLSGHCKVTFRDLKSDGSNPRKTVHSDRLACISCSDVTIFCADKLIASETLHGVLRLSSGDTGLLFVHDANDPRLEESLLCLHRHIELLYRYGGRGVWVVINKMDLIPPAERLRTFNDVKARFEFELATYRDDMRWRVLELPDVSAKYGRQLREVLSVLATELPEAPATRPLKEALPAIITLDSVDTQMQHGWNLLDEEMDAGDTQEWWDRFLHGKIAPWRHVDYLRAAYLTILQPENRGRGLLQVATDFGAKLHEFKQRSVAFRLLPQPRYVLI